MQLNQNQRVNLGYWTYCFKAFKQKCKGEHLKYSSLAQEDGHHHFIIS